ncbi:flagellar biosynthesis protein FlhB [Saccharospirillum salsuginis]|uniref:Flagellar biosynthetic protein FlhB n=1 Tax=Saccharospirillum salsuginis TaxID=418750 RepID=A0A918K5L0_9GAMM|nr:flagellar biosynthesis protein FlhB [Saccharospirillum salsuginis]GGX50800.1 flagellar biosynthesis protein FlhB [Saccharospirillum salsuginis]
MAEENDSSQERSEEPTERKLKQAKEEGNIARSKELNTSAILVAAAAGFLIFGPGMAATLMDIMKFNFGFDAYASWDTTVAMRYLEVSTYEALKSLIPLFILLLVAAFFGPIGLGGWNFATKAIAPKGSRLNPLSGLKRMFSLNSLVELLKGWGKILLVGTISAILLFGLKGNFISMVFEPTEPSVKHAAFLLAWTFLLMCCSTLIIAALDIPFQIYSHTKKLRMTMQEVKEEFKNTEGKPEVKSKIRQLQREMANRRMMSDVPDADVVITNPEHYAVALKYEPNAMPAPVMLAKGVDQVAFKIREIATEYKIPVMEIPPLARSIYHHTEIGGEIPEGLYIAVAQVLAYVYQTEQWKKGHAPKPEGRPDCPIPNDLREDE